MKSVLEPLPNKIISLFFKNYKFEFKEAFLIFLIYKLVNYHVNLIFNLFSNRLVMYILSFSFGLNTDYGRMMAKSLILCCKIEIPIPKKHLGVGIKSLCFCRNNG